MSIFREIPPTAGFPIRLRDFLSLLNKETYRNSLEDDFKNYLNVQDIKITSSGTAALYLLCEALKEISPRKTVIIPSYICPSVPLAIKRAGLKVFVCDINGYDFNFNLGDLEAISAGNNDILAIVATHLGGFPIDFDSVEKITKQYGIFIIEDCAHALGATYKGRKVGTMGDFSFFSLARGKGLTIYEGGAVAVNNSKYLSLIDKKIEELKKDDFVEEALKIFELFGYWIFYRPQAFWFVYEFPKLFWNLIGKKIRASSEYFTEKFPLNKVSGIRKAIGHLNFYRIEKEIENQRKIASYYAEGLKGIEGIKILKEDSNSRAIYPFLTLIFGDPNKRKKALRILEKMGLGASEIYMLPITDYPYLKDITFFKDPIAARNFVGRHITLSTSTFLRKDDLDRIIKVIKLL